MTSRLTFDAVPEAKGALDRAWAEKLRLVLDASFRSIRSVLDVASGGLRLRESVRCVDCVIDTGRTPHAIVAVDGMKKPPIGVLLLRARNQRTATGQCATGNALSWEFRGASVLIHAATGLSASTRYDCVIAVLEE